jgi:hypothetical protein
VSIVDIMRMEVKQLVIIIISSRSLFHGSDMVAHDCNPSYARDGGGRIIVPSQPGQKPLAKPYLKKTIWVWCTCL